MYARLQCGFIIQKTNLLSCGTLTPKTWSGYKRGMPAFAQKTEIMWLSTSLLL